MNLSQTLGWLLVFPLVVVRVASLPFTESVFPLHPLIDTRLPQGFAEVNFNKIQPKMTKAEVFRLIQAQPDQISSMCYLTQLGNADHNENKKLPNASNNLSTIRGHSCWEYGSDGAAMFFGDYAWFSFRILFDENDRVITTERVVHYD
jgi:hypothetical protein